MPLEANNTSEEFFRISRELSDLMRDLNQEIGGFQAAAKLEQEEGVENLENSLNYLK